MPSTASDLDFSVLDRARTLGDLLRLLFALMEAVGPKEVADLLTDFDGLVVVDPETAGRWLRNERRPSKQHLKLIVRLLQSRDLMGTPPARDRVFIRIAAFYAKIDQPVISSRAPLPIPNRIRPQAPLPVGSRFRALREDYELALALQFDLSHPGGDLTRFEARSRKPRPLMRTAATDDEFDNLMASFCVMRDLPAPPSRWQRLALRLRAAFRIG